MGEDGFVLPSGTVSLLLSDIQGFTRSREWDPEGTNRALAEVNATLDDLIGRFDGVQPLEQGEGDSCVTTFERARGAVACSLALQQALIRAPLKLPVGVHTGDVQRRDDRNHAGATVTRTARVRNLGGGGKNLLSQAT